MSDDKGPPDLPPQEEQRGQRLVFHYSRDRRLENAPESVQRAYREGYTPNKGFLKGLTANSGLRSIFVTIIILSAVIGGITFFGDKPGSVTVDGSSFKLKAFPYEENVFITLQIARKSPDNQILSVSVTFSALDARGTVVDTKVVQGALSGSELVLRTVMTDKDVASISAKVRLGNRDTVVSAAVDRN
jgi:hypothetical protein